MVYKRRKGKEEETSGDSDAEICVPLSKHVTIQEGKDSDESRVGSTKSSTESPLEKGGESAPTTQNGPLTPVHQLIKERLSKASGYVADPS